MTTCRKSRRLGLVGDPWQSKQLCGTCFGCELKRNRLCVRSGVDLRITEGIQKHLA